MRAIPLLLVCAMLAIAQVDRPFQSQSTSSVVSTIKDGQRTVEVVNVGYELSGKLLLRKTTRTKEVIDEIGVEALTTIEAWPLGVDPRQKPQYSLKVDGVDARVVDGALITILRGVEDTEWWSVYQLHTGARLFDTYVPLLGFSIRRDLLTMRYAGFEIPERQPANLVGVLIYGSADHAIRKALITSDDPKQATALRSFADASRVLTLVETPARALRLAISQNYPSAPATVTITIPIVKDDLDIAHAQMPAHVHIAAWKR